VDLFSSKLNPVLRVADPEKRQSLRQHRCTQANGPTAPRLRAPDPSTATKLEESSVAVDPSTWRRNGCFVWVAIPRSCTSGPSLSDNNIQRLRLFTHSFSCPVVAIYPVSLSVFCACSSFKVSNICELDSRSLQQSSLQPVVPSLHPRFSVLRLSAKTLSQNTRAFRVLLFHSFLG